jgi:hypothetical protein
MSDTLLTALALVLVLEGLLPMAAPGVWRTAFTRMLELRDGQLRFLGVLSIAMGLLLLWFLES